MCYLSFILSTKINEVQRRIYMHFWLFWISELFIGVWILFEEYALHIIILHHHSEKPNRPAPDYPV